MEFNIKLSIYFEVKGSPIYGGLGTIGYVCRSVDIEGINYGKANIFNDEGLMEQYIGTIRKQMAELCEVSEGNVQVISQEEYEANTEEDDEE